MAFREGSVPSVRGVGQGEGKVSSLFPSYKETGEFRGWVDVQMRGFLEQPRL